MKFTTQPGNRPVVVHGPEVQEPRDVLFFGTSAPTHSYSGLKRKPLPFPPELFKVRNKLMSVLRRSPLKIYISKTPNCCLANLYLNGNDSMGFHSDNEPYIGANSLILSLSFGATRKFLVQNINTGATRTRFLASGDLLIMYGKSRQDFYEHAVPKEPEIESPRLNLTFRYHSYDI
jgi:alkylated DNA repair dioxygenase AlkB